MKLFFRRRDGIAFLFALCFVLCYLAACIGIGTTMRSIPSLHLRRPFDEPSSVNSTMLRLASLDPFQADVRNEIESLVDGTFNSSDPRFWSVAWWRRIGNLQEQVQRNFSVAAKTLPICRLHHNVYPEFRRILRDWYRRRRFQPEIISELVGLVKRPLDIHFSGDRLDFSATQKYRSCAVVGNSGILMRNERGSLIDEHEIVVRLNNARIVGYQKYVGKKTNISFVNSNILYLCSRQQSCFCHPYGANVPIIMYICQPAHFIDYTLCNSSHRAPLIITDPRFDLLCARIIKYYSLKRFVDQTGKPPEEWGKFHDGKEFHYSSGMQAVMLAVGICDRVSIFGFGKSTGARHHYHTNQTAELSLHDFEAEYLLYRDLTQKPHAVPFLAESGFSVPKVVAYG